MYKHCDCCSSFPAPYIIDVNSMARHNTNFRAEEWTGNNMQLTLMSIPVNKDIGVEVHEHTDQMIRIESGCAMAVMWQSCDNMCYRQELKCGDAVFIPAGTWHNIINIGRCSLKLSSVYAPPAHRRGTVQKTKD